jgi:hypothetical protein
VEPVGIDLLAPGLSFEIGGGNLGADAGNAVVEDGKLQPARIGRSFGQSSGGR